MFDFDMEYPKLGFKIGDFFGLFLKTWKFTYFDEHEWVESGGGV